MKSVDFCLISSNIFKRVNKLNKSMNKRIKKDVTESVRNICYQINSCSNKTSRRLWTYNLWLLCCDAHFIKTNSMELHYCSDYVEWIFSLLEFLFHWLQWSHHVLKLMPIPKQKPSIDFFVFPLQEAERQSNVEIMLHFGHTRTTSHWSQLTIHKKNELNKSGNSH